MATYDIDKITLPSGDVCNLTIPDASATQAGKVSTDTQHFGGQKYFDYGNIVLDSVAHSPAVNYRQISFKDGNIQSSGNTVQNAVIISQTSAVGVTTGNKMGFRLKSPTANGTAYTSYYDTYGLPAATAGLTANAEYNIITTKNISDIPLATFETSGLLDSSGAYQTTYGAKRIVSTATQPMILSLQCGPATEAMQNVWFGVEFRDPLVPTSEGSERGVRRAALVNRHSNTSTTQDNRFEFWQYSPTTDGTNYSGSIELYKLPVANTGLTSNTEYDILTTKNTKTYTASLTTAGWSSNTQTVNVTGMTANAIIMVSAAPASEATYRHSGVYCSAQAANSLTFTCASTPTAAITVNILTIG